MGAAFDFSVASALFSFFFIHYDNLHSLAV
jgi:hypothetical protein